MGLDDEGVILKDDARPWTVKEQIVEDLVTSLTFQFEVIPHSTARYRLRIFGDIPFGNRELIFNEAGEMSGSGTFTSGLCKPTWFEKMEETTEERKGKERNVTDFLRKLFGPWAEQLGMPCTFLYGVVCAGSGMMAYLGSGVEVVLGCILCCASIMGALAVGLMPRGT